MSEWLVLTIAMAVGLCRRPDHRRPQQPRDRRGRRSVRDPDVIEYMTMMIGVVYAIVLGLAIAGVWEGRSAAQESVRLEAQALHEVSERAAGSIRPRSATASAPTSTLCRPCRRRPSGGR